MKTVPPGLGDVGLENMYGNQLKPVAGPTSIGGVQLLSVLSQLKVFICTLVEDT